CSERLVVDAGGADRARDKRYWHDSGLSDSSYVQRRRRPHRRSVDGHRERRASGSAYRPPAHEPQTCCAQTCCAQNMCEVTSEVTPPPNNTASIQQNVTKKNFGQNVFPSAPRRWRDSDSSDVTSSSRSWGNERRRDRRRVCLGCSLQHKLRQQISQLIYLLEPP
ncbi:jg27763, partial [Pararge aegeria aegeria]